MTQYNIELETLKTVPLTEIWKHEARDFTPWLADNIELLGNAIGMELDVIETEKSVGPFFADIYAEDKYGNAVVIENQFGKTDHKHLGQLVTYAAGLKSKSMVWITSKADPGHITAINWLNNLSVTTDFYLVEITVMQIGDSKCAVRFDVVCSPAEIVDPIKEHYQKFWEGLKEIDGNLYKNTTSLKRRWLEITNNGITWDTTLANRSGYILVHTHIDNKPLYDSIKSHRENIEQSFGEELVWTENVKSVRIKFKTTIGGIKDEDKWDEIQHDLVNRMSRLKAAIEPYLEAAEDKMRD